MNNKYGLPEDRVDQVRARDQSCVYCHKKMIAPSSGGNRGDWATIEHLNHMPPWDNPDTIAMCCGSCNSSRGKRSISNWFESAYCKEKGINFESVATPIQEYICLYET